jgi:hypothetical protein
MYLILHILQIKGNSSALVKTLDGKMEPGAVIVLWMVGGDPDVVLWG